tara:strand:- start:360 stop:620 length:261 start_codon:yes stop_codon:yes gene_type:complete
MTNIPKEFQNRLWLSVNDIQTMLPLSDVEIRKMANKRTWGPVQRFGRKITVKAERFWGWQVTQEMEREREEITGQTGNVVQLRVGS